MAVSVKGRAMFGLEFNLDIQEFTEWQLDGDDYDMGVYEAVTQTAKNNSKAIGRLMEELFMKGLIDADVIKRVVDIHLDQSVPFIATKE